MAHYDGVPGQGGAARAHSWSGPTRSDGEMAGITDQVNPTSHVTCAGAVIEGSALNMNASSQSHDTVIARRMSPAFATPLATSARLRDLISRGVVLRDVLDRTFAAPSYADPGLPNAP
eukprot:4280894-Pyramimonas_sp.AAC.1